MMARRLVSGTVRAIFEGDRLHNEGGGHFLHKIQPIAREGKVTEFSGKKEIAREEGKAIAREEGKATEKSDYFPDTEASIRGDESTESNLSYILPKGDLEKTL